MAPPPAAAHARLIARAQLGDRQAMDALLAGLQQPLYHHVRLLLGDPHAAEDVLQDVMLLMCRRLPSLRDPRWFRAWAYRIATREALRQARRGRRDPEATDPHLLDALPDDAPEPRFDPELVARLPDAIASLPPASRVVLHMHYVDGLTLVEVAEALELRIGTVKSRLAYGLAGMRALIAVRD